MMDEFYLKDYKGDAHSAQEYLPAGETIRLPEQPCRFVMLSNWNTTDDEQFTTFAAGTDLKDSGNELYYGFDGSLAHQLFPGETTDLIPVNNLSQITVRRPANNAADNPQIYYTWFN